eukprot:scaffold77110_cov54-Phaeocystis_antarctica.AAC.3
MSCFIVINRAGCRAAPAAPRTHLTPQLHTRAYTCRGTTRSAAEGARPAPARSASRRQWRRRGGRGGAAAGACMPARAYLARRAAAQPPTVGRGAYRAASTPARARLVGWKAASAPLAWRGRRRAQASSGAWASRERNGGPWPGRPSGCDRTRGRGRDSLLAGVARCAAGCRAARRACCACRRVASAAASRAPRHRRRRRRPRLRSSPPASCGAPPRLRGVPPPARVTAPSPVRAGRRPPPRPRPRSEQRGGDGHRVSSLEDLLTLTPTDGGCGGCGREFPGGGGGGGGGGAAGVEAQADGRREILVLLLATSQRGWRGSSERCRRVWLLHWCGHLTGDEHSLLTLTSGNVVRQHLVGACFHVHHPRVAREGHLLVHDGRFAALCDVSVPRVDLWMGGAPEHARGTR